MSADLTPRCMGSAPKDGTHILSYGYHGNDCWNGDWLEDAKSGAASVGWAEVYADKNGGWYNLTGYPSKPVIWIPLPDPEHYMIEVDADGRSNPGELLIKFPEKCHTITGYVRNPV